MTRLLFILVLLLPTWCFAAFTERYVTVAGAGAHDGTSEANAWTFAEAVAATPAVGTRINIKTGSYSVAATGPNWLTGTASAISVMRGYNSTIGDLDGQGRNADGTLNTTNFPVVTLTGLLGASPYAYFQNIVFTGASTGHLAGNNSTDSWGFVNCTITNTENNAGARCIQGDNNIIAINTDFECSGASHASVIDADIVLQLIGCRVKGVAAVSLVTVDSGAAIDTVFIGNAGPSGIEFLTSASGTLHVVTGCTFYNLATHILLPNATPVVVGAFANNHATDATTYINNQHSGTADASVIEFFNRTRDNATPRTGIHSIVAGEVTTDTGDASTDYTNAAGDDFTLISGAPGRGAASVTNRDIGAVQHESAGGSPSVFRSTVFGGP